MTHTYDISGMTCSGCQAKVQGLLSNLKGINNVTIDLKKGEAAITMDEHVPFAELQSALKDYPKYQITEKNNHVPEMKVETEKTKSLMQTYKPVLLIFGYISVIALLIEYVQGGFSWMRWMNHFMAGFFLVFSFFKLLDLKGFAESYSMYDIVARKWNGWGYVYAFVELGQGLAFLTGMDPILTNVVTFTIMTISIIGVLQTIFNKRKIKCACLGAVFELPMSSITIIEDALMIGMSAVMLLTMLL